MSSDDVSILRTRASLLFRLQQAPADQTAWDQFVSRYGPQVRAWCLRWGLQEADADDVVQTVLTQLSQKLGEFQYDPARRFRGWLKTLTQHAWSDFHRVRARQAVGSGDSAAIDALAQVEARDDLAERLQATFDHEILEQAYREVQGRVEERTWQAFLCTAVQGISGADTAKRLGMSVGAVFVAKSSVLAMLREIVKRCEEGE
ncbi:MAG: sigma-70 family RNA polymerase sigma factor [Gemmataceae bacterium]|nr:sigma-70 family RNA polymerase sigma factor [Gemmataceae bacterium]